MKIINDPVDNKKIVPELTDVLKWEGIVKHFLSMFEDMILFCLIYRVREKKQSIEEAKEKFTKNRNFWTFGSRVSEFQKRIKLIKRDLKWWDEIKLRRNCIAHPDKEFSININGEKRKIRFKDRYNLDSQDGFEWLMTFYNNTLMLIMHLTPKVADIMESKPLTKDGKKLFKKFIKLSDQLILDKKEDFTSWHKYLELEEDLKKK